MVRAKVATVIRCRGDKRRLHSIRWTRRTVNRMRLMERRTRSWSTRKVMHIWEWSVIIWAN